MKFLRPFFIALQFLTRLPVPLEVPPTETEMGRSVLCYPLVGALMGGLLMGMAWILQQHLAPGPAAALLLAFWIWLYGGLHLDALADSADAWGGARGQFDRAMRIMKDPNSGPFGVVAVVVLLLLEFALLAELFNPGEHAAAFTTQPVSAFLPLFLASTLGRTVVLPLFLSTAYVRPQGLGSAMHAHLPRLTAGAWLVTIVLLLLVLAGSQACLALLAAGSSFLLLRYLMQREIGGMTGDTAGALIVISEAAVLLACSWHG